MPELKVTRDINQFEITMDHYYLPTLCKQFGFFLPFRPGAGAGAVFKTLQHSSLR